MPDGTVLRADVYYPTDASGKRAAGPFPVVLTLTPYGKGVLGASSDSAGGQTGPSPYLVQRGYIDVVADVRGTGDSRGRSSACSTRVQDTRRRRRWCNWAARAAATPTARSACTARPTSASTSC